MWAGMLFRDLARLALFSNPLAAEFRSKWLKIGRLRQKCCYFGSVFFHIYVFPGILPPRTPRFLEISQKEEPFFRYFWYMVQKEEPFSKYFQKDHFFLPLFPIFPDFPEFWLRNRRYFRKSPLPTWSVEQIYRNIFFRTPFFRIFTEIFLFGPSFWEYLRKYPKNPSSFRNISRDIFIWGAFLPISPRM